MNWSVYKLLVACALLASSVLFGCSLVVGDGDGDGDDTSGEVAENRAPTISLSTSDAEILEGQELSIIVTVEDEDGDDLTINVTDGPAGGTYDAASGAYKWTPPADFNAELYSNGVSSVTLEVVDNGSPNLSASASADITIHNNDDGDIVVDADDNCVWAANSLQVDYDGDGVGLACDSLVELPDSLTKWKNRSYMRYSDMDVRDGNSAFTFSVFDEDETCSTTSSCTQATGLALEGPETLTEAYGENPDDGLEEDWPFIDNGNVSWLSNGNYIFRIKDGLVTLHYHPEDPYTSNYGDFDNNADGSTLVRVSEYWIEDYSNMDWSPYRHSAYHWLGEVETPIYTDKPYLTVIVKEDATYVLARNDDDTPEFTSINGSGITTHPLVASYGRELSIHGDDVKDYWLCTSNNISNTATAQLFRGGNPVPDASMAFTDVATCTDISVLYVEKADESSNSVGLDGASYISVTNINGTWDLFRWKEDGGGLASLGNLVAAPYRVFHGGDEVYVTTDDDTWYWVSDNPDMVEVCAGCPYGGAEIFVADNGTITSIRILPEINISVPFIIQIPARAEAMQAYRDTVQMELFPTTSGMGETPSWLYNYSWDADDGTVWALIRDGSSPYTYGLFTFSGPAGAGTTANIIANTMANGQFRVAYVKDFAGNILIGNSANLYTVTPPNTLTQVATAYRYFYVMHRPLNDTFDAHAWVYYFKTSGIYALGSFGDGIFTELYDDLTTYPHWYGDKEGKGYIYFQNAAGWQVVRTENGGVTPVLSDLTEQPTLRSFYVDFFERLSDWIIYRDGDGNHVVSELVDGNVEPPVLWSNDRIQSYGSVFWVQMTPVDPLVDDRNALCDFSNPKKCNDVHIPDLSFERSPLSRTVGNSVALVEDRGADPSSIDDVLYIWRNMENPVSNDCCAARGGPGCESTGIMACVCAEFPDCCTVQWTADCAAAVGSMECAFCL